MRSKLNVSNVLGKLNRNEMKSIKAGSGGNCSSSFTVVCKNGTTSCISSCYLAPDLCRNQGGEKSCVWNG